MAIDDQFFLELFAEEEEKPVACIDRYIAGLSPEQADRAMELAEEWAKACFEFYFEKGAPRKMVIRDIARREFIEYLRNPDNK